MALPLNALVKLKPLLKGDVLSLAYPDLHVSAKDIEKHFGYKPEKFTKANVVHGGKEPLPETEEFCEKLGINLTVVDFEKVRGTEKVANLNYPHDLGKFDLVIDPGTLEHCFNIGQGFLNAANAVKAGGHIFHISPMSMMNHGFYNLCPTLYYDFYTQNHWRVEEIKVIPRPFKLGPTSRYFLPTEYMIYAQAQRMEEEPLIMPIQSKYLEKK